MKFFISLSGLISAISLIYIASTWFRKRQLNNKILIFAAFSISFLMLCLSLILDFSNDFLNSTGGDYTKVGPYGDLIGGLVNPFIAFIGVIAASFAFYAQYKANIQVQEQFNLQKFESQFYEMVRMHRENLNEMKIEGYKYEYDETDTGKYVKPNTKKEKTTSGKKIFVTMLVEFHAIHLIAKKIFMKYHSNSQSNLQKLQTIVGKQLIFDHAYYVFFNGITIYSQNKNRYIESDTTQLLSPRLLSAFEEELKSKRDFHLKKGIKNYQLYYIHRNEYFRSENLWLSFNYKPFSGHQSLLAHHYRHLFQTVKFVVKQDTQFLSYESKRDYLRILRGTLSNHEQILLYYNWLSGFGSQWEKKYEPEHSGKDYNNHENKFFTDYRMIHNIPNDLVLDEFKLEKIFDSKYHNFKTENNRKEFDTLFELVKLKK